MGKPALFVDFGSTFTKICAFDLEREILLGRAKSPSTVDTDITIGLQNALELLSQQTPIDDDAIRSASACSSAAGGLRVVCIGLTPDLTTQAGKIAAFGAGAKITGVYSYQMTEDDCAEIEATKPDVVLLTGGTDGGNQKNLIHNAELLAKTGAGVPNILVAGNKSAYDALQELFAPTGKNVIYTKNILPALNQLQTEHINEIIRELFISRITKSRGIDKASALIGKVLMPTPSAVLAAATLAADGAEGEPGVGDLMIVDVGGATTDVYSVCDGFPTVNGVSPVGLQEPRVKRTVEGDLGLYHNLDSLTDAARQAGISLDASDEEALSARLRQTFSIPTTPQTEQFHVLLSKLAIRTAVERHCGSLIPLSGGRFVQKGKDLSEIPVLVGAGGPIVFSPDFSEVLRGALKLPDDKLSLMPVAPQFYRDDSYILYAVGLMAETAPLTALHILKKYIFSAPNEKIDI